MTPVAPLFLLAFGCSCLAGLRALKVNQRPIIGILAQESHDPDLHPYGKTYIAAPYVKYLESAGCRVMPIRMNLAHEEYERIFHSINGILIPGGAANLKTSNFVKVAKLFYDLAVKAFDGGDYFPIWGTCLGLQVLATLTAGKNLLIHTDSENISLPLNLTNDAIFQMCGESMSHTYLKKNKMPTLVQIGTTFSINAGALAVCLALCSTHSIFAITWPTAASSKMFQNFPLDVYRALSTEPLAANFHHFSLSVQAFQDNEKLNKFFSILTTNNDRKGIQFVSTMEGIRYPFYGVQWHPEVSRFQWQPDLAFPHSPYAVQLSFLLADFFVNEARKNFHYFPSPEEESASLIYNYSPRYIPASSYIQVYFF